MTESPRISDWVMAVSPFCGTWTWGGVDLEPPGASISGWEGICTFEGRAERCREIGLWIHLCLKPTPPQTFYWKDSFFLYLLSQFEGLNCSTTAHSLIKIWWVGVKCCWDQTLVLKFILAEGSKWDRNDRIWQEKNKHRITGFQSYVFPEANQITQVSIRTLSRDSRTWPETFHHCRDQLQGPWDLKTSLSI